MAIVVAGPLTLAACADEEPGGVEASVARAQLDVDPMRPDSLATLELTVDLQARGQAVEVRFRHLAITALPLSESSEELSLMAELVSTQGDEPVVRLQRGEMGVARMINAGTLNEELAPWCGLPVELAVVVVTDADEEVMATQDISVRCP